MHGCCLLTHQRNVRLLSYRGIAAVGEENHTAAYVVAVAVCVQDVDVGLG